MPEMLTLALCLILAGLAAAIETALVGLPTLRAEAAMASRPRGARFLQLWLRHPHQVLATLHGVRSALTLGAGFAAYAGLPLLGIDLAPVWVVCLLALLSLGLSHVVPRTLAKRYPVQVAAHTMWLVAGLTYALWPLIWPLSALSRSIVRPRAGSGTGHGPFWTPDELHRVTADAHAASLGERGEDLFSSIIEFSDTVIREIMVPRTDMIALPQTSTHAEVQHRVLEARHSRIPVYDETIDNITGILHVKDLVSALVRGDSDLDIKLMLRPTFYVPEIMKISELLREFQRRKTHLAIVVDEYGGTAGVVTLEDIIEEIVGEIQDEYDVEEKQFRVLADNKIIADGRVSIWDIEAALGVEFPNDADYETLAGFLLSRTGALPETGMLIRWNNLRFTIKEANEKRVGMVEIEQAKG